MNKKVIEKSDFTEVGKLGKAHGIDGRLMMKTNELFPDDPNSIEYLMLEIDTLLVPYPLLELEFRDDEQAVVLLEFIKQKEEAATFYGVNVFVLNELIEEQEATFTMDQLIGFELNDQEGKSIGEIHDYTEYPNNSVFHVMIEDQEVLIPAVPEWIQNLNEDEKFLWMNIPEGLLDVYLDDEEF